MVLRGSLPLTAENIQRFFGGGEPGTGPRNSYSQVAAVYACVRARAEAIAGMPLMLSSGDDEVIESGPLVELAEHPNPGMTGRVFWQTSSSILDLFGKLHWMIDLDTAQRVRALYPVAPPQMRPVKNERTGEVTGWKYRPAGRHAGHEETLSVDEVHTIIDPDFENTHDPLRGLSPRQAVAMAISQYFKADVANEASLDNGVEPGFALSMEGNPTEQQIKDARQEMRERHAGVRNRRRFMLLYGGLKAEKLGAAFKEMEFTELKKMARTDIAAAFGVPGPVINYFEDSNYAHANSAQEAFWVNPESVTELRQ